MQSQCSAAAYKLVWRFAMDPPLPAPKDLFTALVLRCEKHG